MALQAVPITTREANDFVASHHRHNKPVRGARWAVGASDGAALIGVAIVGRPTARALQDGTTAEVTRCCVADGAPKGSCSFLYACCWRAWRALGGRRLVTYTLGGESGASLRGAGAKVLAELPARDPAGWQSRSGREWQPVVGQAKIRWEWAA
jgi:hypothetical protein